MFNHHDGRYALLVLGALTACQHAAVGPTAVNAPATRTPPAAIASVAALVSTPPRPPASEPEPAETSPFVDGVRMGYTTRLTITGKTALISTQKLLLGIHDDRVLIDPSLLDGLDPGTGWFPRVFGSMPEMGWVVSVEYESRTTRHLLSRWTGSGWQDANLLLQRSHLLTPTQVIGISTWSDGRMLALAADEYEKQLNFVQLGGPRGVPLPQLDHAARNGFGCVHGIKPTAMSALPSGEVFLAGTRCSIAAGKEVTDHGAVIEHWSAGQARGKLSALPGLAEREASADLSSIVALSDNDVFVAGVRTPKTPHGPNGADEAYIAHFDGQAWRTLPAPPTTRLDDLQRASDGKLWALASGDLWTTTSSAAEGATWQRVPIPRFAKEAGEHNITSFWLQDSGAVWATVVANDFSYLIRTQRGAEPLSAPSDAQVAELTKAVDPGSDCENPTLVVLTFGRQAPKDADMPSVRAALRGHSELEGKARLVELPFLTRRYLAVRGEPDAVREASAILAQAGIPGLEPELRCLNAEPTRVLPVDFSDSKKDAHTRVRRAARE